MIGYISFYGRLGLFVFAVSWFDWFRTICPLRIRCLIDFESSIVTLRWLHSHHGIVSTRVSAIDAKKQIFMAFKIHADVSSNSKLYNIPDTSARILAKYSGSCIHITPLNIVVQMSFCFFLIFCPTSWYCTKTITCFATIRRNRWNKESKGCLNFYLIFYYALIILCLLLRWVLRWAWLNMTIQMTICCMENSVLIWECRIGSTWTRAMMSVLTSFEIPVI